MFYQKYMRNFTVSLTITLMHLNAKNNKFDGAYENFQHEFQP